MGKNRRRFLAMIATANTLSVAGCSSSSDDPAQSSPTPTSPTKTTTQGSSSQPTTQESTADLTYPDGFSSDGIDNTEQIVDGHQKYLLGRSNYTEQWVLQTITASGEVGDGQPTELTVRADPTTERLHLHYHDHANNVEVFYDGTYYEYNVAKDTVSEGESPRLFANVEKQYQSLSFWEVNLLLRKILTTIRVEPTGAHTVSGQKAVTFTVSGVSDSRKEEASNVTFTGAKGSVVVTESGGIHRLEYVPQFESESTSLQTATYELTNTGSTDVSRPEWVPQGSA